MLSLWFVKLRYDFLFLRRIWQKRNSKTSWREGKLTKLWSLMILMQKYFFLHIHSILFSFEPPETPAQKRARERMEKRKAKMEARRKGGNKGKKGGKKGGKKRKWNITKCLVNLIFERNQKNLRRMRVKTLRRQDHQRLPLGKWVGALWKPQRKSRGVLRKKKTLRYSDHSHLFVKNFGIYMSPLAIFWLYFSRLWNLGNVLHLHESTLPGMGLFGKIMGSLLKAFKVASVQASKDLENV